ncbi:hypothetical protein KC325_g289 [Hortaea werneckii]|nr:hypothetical protein KC325_g289 [Hortaea werneckii]
MIENVASPSASDSQDSVLSSSNLGGRLADLPVKPRAQAVDEQHVGKPHQCVRGLLLTRHDTEKQPVGRPRSYWLLRDVPVDSHPSLFCAADIGRMSSASPPNCSRTGNRGFLRKGRCLVELPLRQLTAQKLRRHSVVMISYPKPLDRNTLVPEGQQYRSIAMGFSRFQLCCGQRTRIHYDVDRDFSLNDSACPRADALVRQWSGGVYELLHLDRGSLIGTRAS